MRLLNGQNSEQQAGSGAKEPQHNPLNLAKFRLAA